MRLVVLLLVLLAVGPTTQWSFSGIWEGLKEKIESIFKSHNNGTLTDEHNDLLGNLTEHWNGTDPSDGQLLKQRLKEMRKLIREKLAESHIDPAAQKKIDKFLKKVSRKIRAHIRKGGDNLVEVNEKANISESFYQGDMMLVKEQLDELDPSVDHKQKRQAYRDGRYPSTTWGSTFYYSFNGNLPQKTQRVAQKAINFWQRNTCVNFVNNPNAQNRVNIFQGQGCYSYVGNLRRGVQELSLGRGCDSVGTAAHELGHALGFFHEQSRLDRDNAITVAVQNIVPNYVDQFDKETMSTNNNYNMPYDYGSVMQYGATSASRNGAPTMIARQPEYQDTMGSDIVSFIDVSMMNDHYGCKARCASSQTRCANGGFPHPRDCSKCLCPAGYGGNTCSERPTGCGATLTATATPQRFTGNVAAPAQGENDEFVYCNWLIQAQGNKKVQAKIVSYAQNVCREGCNYGGVEMKWKANPALTGSRYCCPNDVNSVVKSEGNVLPIVGFNRYNRESFTIEYVAVD